ncbi:MAG: DUF1592 domain-containing protein [Myxococcota bacterium]
MAALVGCNGVYDALDSSEPGFDQPPRSSSGKILGPEDIPLSAARRLSRAELDQTLFDLLGNPSRLGSANLPEDNQEREGLFLHWPFDNVYPLQTTDRVLVQAFETLASTAAQELVSDEEQRARIVGCEPTSATDEACLLGFIRDFGRRAFRRPLTDAEVDNYFRLQMFAEETGEFYVAVRAIVTAMLQAPDFLYRVEVGTEVPGLDGVYRLDDYEIATRMSYFLLGTTPPTWLLDQADAGLLRTPDEREVAARRLLEDPQALNQVDRFHSMWLGYGSLPHSPELTTAMRNETRALLERVIFEEDRPYLDLFRIDETYVDTMLAEHYGLPAPMEESWVSYGDSGRSGILSHGSVLSAFATASDTSVTKRGVFVRERLMCQEIPPPPPTVNVDDLPETNCKSELIEVHQMGACGGCHSLMDPIGWGLENYDSAGVFRLHDTDKPECEIAGDGEIVMVGTFRGPGELGTLLVEDGSLEGCAVRQVVRFAFGREETAEDEAFIEEVVSRRRGSGWSYVDLVVGLVASDRFALRREREMDQ